MSFEGYYQVRCTNKHYYTQDCYSHSHSAPCKHCGAPTISNMVDETNGEADGFRADMENGCATEVTILDTELDRLRRENAAMKGLLKLLIDAKIKPAEPVISLYPSYHTAQFARSVAYDDLDLERCENFLRRKNENG